MFVRGDATRLPFADRSFDLVIGSPPYLDARLYLEDGQDLGVSRDLGEWVAWMLDVTAEAVRVSRGLVIWVCAGVTRDWCYQPGPEGLLYEWVKRGGIAWRPGYWRRFGVSGSGGDQWYRADVEYALAFAPARGRMPHAEPTKNGHPPKWRPGGEMSHRMPNGRRVAKFHTKTLPNGTMKVQGYNPPEIANPGNWIGEFYVEGCGDFLDTGASGGGRLGHPLAHENEAPYPVEVPAFFIRSHCPPGGLVLDPFSGSGTTVDAAMSEGREGVGLDLRQSQCELGRKRAATVTPSLAFGE